MKTEQSTKVRGTILHIVLGPRSETPLFTNLLAGLKSKGYKQMVCFLSGSKPEKSMFENIGIESIYLGYNKKKLKKIRISAIKAIKNIICDYDIDIVHGQRHKATLYGVLAAWVSRQNVKVVSTVHGRNRTRNLKRKLTNKLLFRKIDLIVGVSKAVCQDILITNKGLPENKVVCIYNGIDTENFSQATIEREVIHQNLNIHDDKAIVIGTIGRLTPVKGHKYLIEAFYELCRQYNRLYLVIWGEGDERKNLENLLKQKKLTDKVKLPGFTKDVSSALHALDVFVMPSLSEGHPLALLEAMAASLPIVATNVGGIPEIITSEAEGILIPAQDEKQLLAGLEMQLRKPDQERVQNGKLLQSKVKELYSINKMVDKTAENYEKVMCSEAAEWRS